MVHGQIGVLEDRSYLKLVGCHLVMAGLAGDGQLQGLYLKVFHKGLYTVGDSAEIVVVHLLVLGRIVSHQRAAGEHQVRTCRIETFVHEEILLFPSQVAGHFLHVGVEIAGHGTGCLVNGTECALQRSLVVEGFTRI